MEIRTQTPPDITGLVLSRKVARITLALLGLATALAFFANRSEAPPPPERPHTIDCRACP